MFKKFVSLLTAVAFVYSFIAAPCVQGAIDLAGVARGAAQARAALSLPTLSFGLDISPAIGRITDARDFGNGPLVINIQDLHCAPEVQRNIAAILGQVATSFGSPTAGTEPDQSARRIQVFVEGGYGAVDTSWITAIKDPAIRTRVVNALVNDGRLTGSELYAMNSARPPMLAGLENEKLHKENIVRLGKIIENKPRFEKTLKSLRAELGVMQARHFTTQNKRLSRIIESYRAGKLSTGEYHTLLAKYIERISRTPRAYNNVFSLNIDQYPDIKTHLALSALTEHMDYGRVATQMQRFMQGLKGVMPFREYSALLAKSKNFSDMDRLYAVLSTMMSGPADAGPWVSAAQRELARYGELKKFFAYIALKEKINPVGLVREDARLVEDLRAALSRSVSEQEVAFLVDFFDCFDAYLLNRLTAADYEYFKSRFEKFRGVWGKYVFENRVNALADVFPLLDEYYAVNAQRNDVFMQALHLPTMGSNRDVSVVVSGGFHTDGLTALLAQKKISYVTITPNVTQDTRSAGVTYQRLAREQAQVFGSQALQLALGSSYGAKVISANPSEAVIEINGKTIILRGQGAVFTAIEDSNQALADKKISADDFLATVNAAGKLATDQIRALPNSDLAAKIILDLARAVIDSGSSLGWWGEEGLVWKIASDPDVQRLIASSGTDLNDIARLPAFLQGGIADGARDHAALVDRAQGDVFITALLGMPILQNGVEILFGEGLLPATRAASREQRAVAVYNEKLDGNMATIQDETDRFLAQGDDAIAAKLAASGSLQKPQESVFVAVPLEHSKELRAVVLAVQAILRQVLGDTGVPDAMGVTDKVGYMPVGQLHTTQVGSVPLDKVSARQQSAFANIEDAIRNLGLDPWEYEIIGAQLMPNMAVVIKLRVRSGQVKKIRETAGAAIRADGMDAEWRTGDINHVSIAYLKPATPAKLREFNARLKEFNARYLQKPQQERAIRADRIAFFLVINKIIQSAKSRFIDLSRHADNEPVSGDTWITSALLPQLRTYFPRGVKFILSDLNETLNGADRAPITDQKMDELLGILDGMGNGRFGINSGNSMALLNGRFIEPMKRHIPPERWDHYFHNIPIVCANGTQVWRWDHNKQDYVCVFCDDIDSFAGAGTADNIKEAIRAVAAEHAPLVRTALQATVPVLRADLQAVISGEGTLSYADLEKDMQGIVTDNDLVDINAQPEQAAIAVNQLMDIMLAKLSADPMINDSSSENPRGEIGQIYFSPLGRYGRAAWGTMASDGIDRRVYAEALKEKLKNIPHAGKLSIEVNGKLSVYVGLAGRTGKTFGTKQLKRLMGPFRFLPYSVYRE